MSCFKGAVPPLTNSFNFFCPALRSWTNREGEFKGLNFYSVLRQPAITRLGRSITSTQSSSHSFATETGWSYKLDCLGVARLVSGS